MRNVKYLEIADSLAAAIADGEYAPGALLPSESELATTHGVSRVTVRKALDVCRGQGLVDSRQGFGWFVAGGRLRQSLDVLATIEAQLAAAGRRSERRVLSFAFVARPPRLDGLLDDDEVLEVVRVNLADGEPFGEVTVWCPEALGRTLSRQSVERSTFLEVLPVTVTTATQTIGADVAGDVDAERLGVPAGSALLVCERVSRTDEGVVALVSEHRFPAHRTEFVVEAEVAVGQPGLRLVEG